VSPILPCKGLAERGWYPLYPAFLKPTGYTVEGCTHDTIHPTQVPSSSSSEIYQQNLQIDMSSPTDASTEKILGSPNLVFLVDYPQAKFLGFQDALAMTSCILFP
jgi:hypothetical protein